MEGREKGRVLRESVGTGPSSVSAWFTLVSPTRGGSRVPRLELYPVIQYKDAGGGAFIQPFCCSTKLFLLWSESSCGYFVYIGDLVRGKSETCGFLSHNWSG